MAAGEFDAAVCPELAAERYGLVVAARDLADHPGAVTRFVLGLGRKVLAVSHTGRTLTGTERRVKRLETGGACEVAGCARGPGCRLVPHHPTPYAECGTTSLSDTVLLCERNHRDLHVGGHVLRLKDGRRLGPDGWLTDTDRSG